MKPGSAFFRFVALMSIVIFGALFFSFGCSDQKKQFGQYKIRINELGKEQHFDKALALLEESKKKFPEKKEFQMNSYYHIAFGLYGQGRIEQTYSLLEKVSGEYPHSDVISALFARAAIKKGELVVAANILKQYPDNPESFLDDLKKKNFNIWINYNLAACHALLEKKNWRWDI